MLDHNNTDFDYLSPLYDCLVSYNFKDYELKFEETNAHVVIEID